MPPRPSKAPLAGGQITKIDKSQRKSAFEGDKIGGAKKKKTVVVQAVVADETRELEPEVAAKIKEIVETDHFVCMGYLRHPQTVKAKGYLLRACNKTPLAGTCQNVDIALPLTAAIEGIAPKRKSLVKDGSDYLAWEDQFAAMYGQKEIPLAFFKGQCLGGFDAIEKLAKSGHLHKMAKHGKLLMETDAISEVSLGAREA